MATLTKGKTFTNGELVTPATIHQLVDAATISGIVNADISASAAIVDTKLAQISTAGKVLPAAVAGTAVITTDSRLSDARTPVTHFHDDRYYTETEMNTLLAGKQASGSYAPATGIAQSAVTNLTTDLAGKAASSHTHTISDTTGLQTALDGKQASGSYAAATHTHTISDTTGLQTALDGKQASGSYAAASHTHGNITNAGAIGTTANLPVVTGASGQLTTIGSGQSGQILSSAGPNSAPYWANPVSSGSTIISPNNIANTVVQRNEVGSFYANNVQLKSFNVANSSNEIMFAVSPSTIGVMSCGLPAVTSGTNFCDFYRDGIEVGKITTNGNSSVAYNTTSDYRLKTNIEPLTAAVSRLLQIPVHRFNWLADPAAPKVDGFLAHEAQAIVPESVTGHKDQVDAEGKPIHQGIDQSKLVPLLVAAVQELAARVAALEAR